MKHRNFGRFLVAAASISMAVSPITAFANTTAPVVISEEASVDPTMLLDAAVEYADEQKAADSYEKVVPKVKANFEAKLTAAKGKQSSTNADEINTAWSDLVDAIHYLSFTGDRTGLEAAVKELDDKDESKYTADSWAAAKAAVDEGKELLKDENALDADLTAAVTKISDAVGKLVEKTPDPEKVDKDALKAAIADADKVEKGDYTDDTWNAFQDALKAAKDVDKDDNATQEAVNKAKADLDAAKATLKENDPTPAKANKAALKAAIADAATKKEADYKPDTWTAFAKALADAKAVDAKDDATQAEVDKAAADLKAAQSKLVEKEPDVTPEKADKTKLKAELDVHKVKANEKNKYYTDASLKAYNDAAKAAQAVMDKEDATQAEVDKATKDLEAAKKDLEHIMWRLYNPNNGEHMFTTDKNEYDYNVKVGVNGEGEAWIAPADGTAMIRMYNPNSGEHHYTSNEREIAFLEKSGWTNEGMKWYSADKASGKVIHRLFNPNSRDAGSHHYTLADKEKDYLVQIGWNWEHNEADLFYAKREAKK